MTPTSKKVYQFLARHCGMPNSNVKKPKRHLKPPTFDLLLHSSADISVESVRTLFAKWGTVSDVHRPFDDRNYVFIRFEKNAHMLFALKTYKEARLRDWKHAVVAESPSNSQFEIILRNVPAEVTDTEWIEGISKFGAVRVMFRLPEIDKDFSDIFLSMKDGASHKAIQTLIETVEKYKVTIADVVLGKFVPPVMNASSKKSGFNFVSRLRNAQGSSDEKPLPNLPLLLPCRQLWNACGFTRSIRHPSASGSHVHPSASSSIDRIMEGNANRILDSISDESRDHSRQEEDAAERRAEMGRSPPEDPSDVWFLYDGKRPTFNEELEKHENSGLNANVESQSDTTDCSLPMIQNKLDNTDNSIFFPSRSPSPCHSPKNNHPITTFSFPPTPETSPRLYKLAPSTKLLSRTAGAGDLQSPVNYDQNSVNYDRDSVDSFDHRPPEGRSPPPSRLSVEQIPVSIQVIDRKVKLDFSVSGEYDTSWPANGDEGVQLTPEELIIENELIEKWKVAHKRYFMRKSLAQFNSKNYSSQT